MMAAPCEKAVKTRPTLPRGVGDRFQPPRAGPMDRPGRPGTHPRQFLSWYVSTYDVGLTPAIASRRIRRFGRFRASAETVKYGVTGLKLTFIGQNPAFPYPWPILSTVVTLWEPPADPTISSLRVAILLHDSSLRHRLGPLPYGSAHE